MGLLEVKIPIDSFFFILKKVLRKKKINKKNDFFIFDFNIKNIRENKI